MEGICSSLAEQMHKLVFLHMTETGRAGFLTVLCRWNSSSKNVINEGVVGVIVSFNSDFLRVAA